MKNTRKHHFSHPDPERIVGSITKKAADSKKISPEDLLTAKDLRRVLVSIGGFTIILIALYFLNLKFELLQRFTDLVHF